MLAEGPTPEEENIITDHAAYVKKLTEEGVVLLAGRTLNTDASSFGIVIFEANDDGAARSVMEKDPAVVKGLMRAEVFPYRIAFTSMASR
jgi:uncharacterized protein YciI